MIGDVISYFWAALIEVANTGENAASDSFVSNFSGATFRLPTNWWASCFEITWILLIGLGPIRSDNCLQPERRRAPSYGILLELSLILDT